MISFETAWARGAEQRTTARKNAEKNANVFRMGGFPDEAQAAPCPLLQAPQRAGGGKRGRGSEEKTPPAARRRREGLGDTKQPSGLLVERELRAAVLLPARLVLFRAELLFFAVAH